jgi:hypothetical protein
MAVFRYVLVLRIDIKVRHIWGGQSKHRKDLLLLDFAIVLKLGSWVIVALV